MRVVTLESLIDSLAVAIWSAPRFAYILNKAEQNS